jgi:hypothetical protein
VGGRIFREELQAEKGGEGKVVGVFDKTGTPAVVVRKAGKGQAILLGFSLGIPLLEDHDAGALELLRAVWKSAGVQPAIEISTAANAGPVEAIVHSRGRDDERLAYLLNWGHKPASISAELPWAGQSPLRAKDMVSGRSVAIAHSEDRAKFNIAIPADHAAAIHIE